MHPPVSASVSETFARFQPWLEAEDVHARHHLGLLRQAEELLSQPALWGGTEARRLAAQLERWRYQHLNERQGQWRPVDWQLADFLDDTARKLAGRPMLPPRRTYQAVFAEGEDPPAIRRALEVLDPALPWEEVADQARKLTEENFPAPEECAADWGSSEAAAAAAHRQGTGSPAPTKRRMFLYAPLYLSSFCVNYCLYCGFRFEEPIERKHLTVEEARREAEVLRARGFRHILLVAGDFPQLVSVEYMAQVIATLGDLGAQLGIEIAAQSTESYEKLVAAGAVSITLYQETYNLPLYQLYHPRGPKAAFLWRLEALDRAAEAGMKRLGLGILLGLADPREDLRALLRHGRYLQERFPEKRLAFSLPRIHEAPPSFRVSYPVPDDLFMRMYCALRLAFPRAELVLSTREAPELRNRLAQICITQMSAGSSTVPGGYLEEDSAAELGQQFPVHDPRSPAEVAAFLRGLGIVPVWQID
jgi:2-iminoacetate synthase